MFDLSLARFHPRKRRSLRSILGTLAGMRRRRRHLRTPDPHLRRDIGLSDAEIRRESWRPA